MRSIARLALASTLLIATPSNALAQENNCEAVLNECDRALSSCMELVEAHEAEGAALRRMLQHKNEEIADLNVWYRQPQYMVPAAILVGLLGGLALAK
jgi:hypothetical protein